jgi:endonuclease VIII
MEGPSLVILQEELLPFIGQRIVAAVGNSKQLALHELAGQTLLGVKPWGKHLLLQTTRHVFRIHFMMYGSYRINDVRKDRAGQPRPPRLSLQFKEGVVNFYSCSIRELSLEQLAAYDWSKDPMSAQWSELRAIRALQGMPKALVCDALLDQSVFSGVGNIIKNEVLHLLGIHPMTQVGDLTRPQLRKLVRATYGYCHQFYRWKKDFVLRKNWKVYRQRQCARCGRKPTLRATGKLGRISFYCLGCQARTAAVPRKTARKVPARKVARAA